MIDMNKLHEAAQKLHAYPVQKTGFPELDEYRTSQQEAFLNVVAGIGELKTRHDALLLQARELKTKGLLDMKHELAADALDTAADLLRAEASKLVVPDSGLLKKATEFFESQLAEVTVQRTERVHVVEKAMSELNNGRPSLPATRRQALMSDREMQRLKVMEGACRERLNELAQKSPSIDWRRSEALTSVHAMIRQELSN